MVVHCLRSRRQVSSVDGAGRDRGEDREDFRRGRASAGRRRVEFFRLAWRRALEARRRPSEREVGWRVGGRAFFPLAIADVRLVASIRLTNEEFPSISHVVYCRYYPRWQYYTCRPGRFIPLVIEVKHLNWSLINRLFVAHMFLLALRCFADF